MNHGKTFVTDLLDNINNCPLEEEFFNPNNLAECLEHEKYHHSYKGCEIEMKLMSKYNGKSKTVVNKFCKTHNILCSKTGWELGHYQGTQSKGLMRVHYCQMCGKEIHSHQPRVYFCKECYPLFMKEKYAEEREQRRKIKEQRESFARANYGDNWVNKKKSKMC